MAKTTGKPNREMVRWKSNPFFKRFLDSKSTESETFRIRNSPIDLPELYEGIKALSRYASITPAAEKRLKTVRLVLEEERERLQKKVDCFKEYYSGWQKLGKEERERKIASATPDVFIRRSDGAKQIQQINKVLHTIEKLFKKYHAPIV